MKGEMERINVKLTVPSFKNCTDNAAMIGVAGYFQDKKENLND
jgi:tRNA A37 threonylcarbamoyltransferase TsaD